MLDGRIVPGVTKILSLVSDYAGIPGRILAAAQERGTHTHMACEFSDLGILDEGSVSAEVRPRLAAWRKFCAEYSAEWMHIEAPLYSRAFGFAGTVDRIGLIRDRSGERLVILDIKTSAKRLRAWGLQLSAYRIAAELPDAQRVALRLLGDGTYRLDEFTDPSEDAVFRALLAVNTWSNK
jgi:PD-(D/E)XK nuclease superfamily